MLDFECTLNIIKDTLYEDMGETEDEEEDEYNDEEQDEDTDEKEDEEKQEEEKQEENKEVQEQELSAGNIIPGFTNEQLLEKLRHLIEQMKHYLVSVHEHERRYAWSIHDVLFRPNADLAFVSGNEVIHVWQDAQNIKNIVNECNALDLLSDEIQFIMDDFVEYYRTNMPRG